MTVPSGIRRTGFLPPSANIWRPAVRKQITRANPPTRRILQRKNPKQNPCRIPHRIQKKIPYLPNLIQKLLNRLFLLLQPRNISSGSISEKLYPDTTKAVCRVYSRTYCFFYLSFSEASFSFNLENTISYPSLP